MGALRIVVAVSRDRSDLYFANQLMQRFKVAGVIVENQLPAPDNTPALLKAVRLASQPMLFVKRLHGSLMQRFHSRYAIYNQPANLTDFGEQGLSLAAPQGCNVIYTRGVRDINAPENIDWLKEMRPDVVAVCGASILKREFLSIPTRGVLNLHGGLSQRYRGLNTTDWAVYNGEPEYVGATVHFVSPGIDDGDIIYQGRPMITATDTPNSLYVKVVKLGVNMMGAAISDIEKGTLKTARVPSRGALYLAKDFTDRMRGTTWKRCRGGVISNYLANKTARDAKVDQIIINEFSGKAVS